MASCPVFRKLAGRLARQSGQQEMKFDANRAEFSVKRYQLAPRLSDAAQAHQGSDDDADIRSTLERQPATEHEDTGGPYSIDRVERELG